MGATNFHAIELDEPIRLDQLAAPYHLEQLHGRRQGKGSEAGVWLIGVESEVFAVFVRRVSGESTPYTVSVESEVLGDLLIAERSGDGFRELAGDDARVLPCGDVLRCAVQGAADVLVCIVLRRPHAAA